MASRTYRAVPDVKLMVTVLPVAALKDHVADGASVENVVPSALPCTDRVSVRDDHAVAGGRFSTTEPTCWDEPRSTVRVAGKPVPSQYVLVLPSVALAATKPWVTLE